jgi:hypothetical protein
MRGGDLSHLVNRSGRWRFRRWAWTILLAAWEAFSLSSGPPAAFGRSTPPIWLGPQLGSRATADLPDLFRRASPWQTAAAHVSVVAISGQVFLEKSNLDVPRMLSDLADRKITIELGISPLSGNDRCGFGVESYSAANQPLSDARRLQALGAVISYVSLDEPLFYGHVYSGKNACEESIQDIAREVAVKLNKIHEAYPNVSVGDVEPVGFGKRDWIDRLEEWFDAFEAFTGQKLAFFRADIQWNQPWEHELDELRAKLVQRGIALQVIYNGGGRTDAEWVASAVKHFQSYESGGRPPPDVAMLQSWDHNPTRLLPENNPLALTNLIIQYASWELSHD